MAKGILGSKEVRWKWAVWNGVGAQGEGHDGVLGGCRATQSRVKSGVQGAGCSSGGMQSGVPGGRQGEEQSERRSAARGGAQVGGGVEDKAVRAGGVRWEEAKMACEITSDAILPI